MPLTDLQCRNVEKQEKDYKLADGGGLYLYVTSKGAKSWRFKYRFAGKEKRLVFGRYPELKLADARNRRDDARRLLRDHRDPAIEEHKRKMAAHASAGATMEKIGRQWHEAQKPRWSPKYARKLIQALERDVFPDLGVLPLADIDGPMILRMLRKVEGRGSIDTAKRVREYVSAVFVFAMSEGIVPHDPAATVGKALKPIVGRRKQPAITVLSELLKLQRAIDESTANPATKLGSRLLAITSVRAAVLCGARWSEFEGIDWSDPKADAPNAVWRVPAARMKLELEDKSEDAFEHDVPLPDEAVAILRALHRLTGRLDLLFPSVRSTRNPMSTNAMEQLYRREGFRGRHVPHGWRTAFLTIMNERLEDSSRDADIRILDMMLAHKPKGVSGSEFAYNRAKFATRRRKFAEQWALLISEGLKHPNDVIDRRVTG